MMTDPHGDNVEQAMETYQVALVGSSGGGTATLGHTDPPHFLTLIDQQLQCSRARLGQALYVALDNNISNNNTPSTAEATEAAVSSISGEGSVLGMGMDAAALDPHRYRATLYRVEIYQVKKNESGSQLEASSSKWSCRVAAQGTLHEVNQVCMKLQQEMALSIRQGHLHGLICVSCHVHLFRDVLQAAAAVQLPCTGSGGTSLSQAVSLYGIRLCGNAGGSVATNSMTKAVSYAHSLSTAWHRPYRPWRPPRPDPSDKSRQHQRPSWVSVLNASLPAFWGVCQAKSIVRFALANRHLLLHRSKSILGRDQRIHGLDNILESLMLALENWVLPTACAVIMATVSRKTTEGSVAAMAAADLMPTSSILMASVLASTACRQSVLSGMLAGYTVSVLADRVLFTCIIHHVPATMTNLVTAGGLGGLVALIFVPVAAILRTATQAIRWSIDWSVKLPVLTSYTADLLQLDILTTKMILRGGAGLFWGATCCYGSKVGWYHAFFLPAILIEMEKGDASFLGAVDELALVMVCAGICTAVICCQVLFFPFEARQPGHSGPSSATATKERSHITPADVSLCQRGLSVNLLCGDFVEVCYPWMEKSLLINLGGYLGASLSVMYLLWATGDDDLPRSLAYLPLPLSIAIAAPQWKAMAVASLIAWGIPFGFTTGSFVIILLLSARRTHSPAVTARPANSEKEE